MKNPTKSEPAMVAGVITAIVSAVSMAVALGWVELSADQVGAVEQFLAALAPVVTAILANWWVRQRVTPSE